MSVSVAIVLYACTNPSCQFYGLTRYFGDAPCRSCSLTLKRLSPVPVPEPQPEPLGRA